MFADIFNKTSGKSKYQYFQYVFIIDDMFSLEQRLNVW